VQKIRNEVSKNYELMEVLHSNALLANDDLQNIHNKIIPDLEDNISDEAKERKVLQNPLFQLPLCKQRHDDKGLLDWYYEYNNNRYPN
jgi:hypothetical protein